MAEIEGSHQSHDMGLHTEQLGGRSQQIFFSAEEGENFFSPDAFDVDFSQRAEIDAGELTTNQINKRIRHVVASRPVFQHLTPQERRGLLRSLYTEVQRLLAA